MSKVFLVTGSSRGLGRAIVLAALEGGHRVIATARRPADLDDIVARFGSSVRAVALDVTDVDAARRAVSTAVAAFGRLDVLVNNAGYADIAAIEDVADADFRAQLETNLYGVVNLTKAALPTLRGQGSGHIITVSSVGGRLATPGLGAYQTAKWALGGFSSVLAAEVGPLGIAVTVLEPGGMRTDWAGSSMSVASISAPYQETVGRSARMHGNAGATLGSDPAKVAQVVLQVAELSDPPLRLLLGSDAYRYATAAGRALLASDEAREALSRSTDADDTPGDHDPLAALTAD
jgi:NAD(P)-dependent dehydrogenase (short-subunit alcohol dehydrogenase family)